MLGRWLGRFAEVSKGLLKPNYWLAGRKRRPKAIPPQMQGEEATPEEVRELKSEQNRESREELMQRVKPRVLREPEEKLERDINKLIQEGKSDRQIIELLAKHSSEQPREKSKSRLQEERKLEENLSKQLQKIGTMSEEDQLIYQQKTLVDMMKQEVPDRKRRPINREQHHYDEVQDAMGKEFMRRERALDIIHNRKDASQYKEPTSSDVQDFTIPEEVQKKVQRYKNKQLKFFAELIQDRAPDGGHMLKKRYRDEPKQTAERELVPVKQSRPVSLESEQVRKQRLFKQYDELTNPTELDSQFTKQGAIDLELTHHSPIILNEAESDALRQFDKKNSTHSRQLAEVKKQYASLQKLGISVDRQQLMLWSKQELMNQKHYLEEQALFNERLQRKERLQKMKKVQSEINREPLSDRVDYKAMEEIEGFNLNKHKDIFGQPDIDKLNQINEKYARSVFVGGREEFDYMYSRTLRNMENWLSHNLTAVSTVSRILHEIMIVEVQNNDKLTLLKVLWRLRPPLQQAEKDFSRYFEQKRQEQTEAEQAKKVQFIQKTLDKTAPIMSVKMCQQLRLRQGPEIRFIHYKQSDEVANSQQRLLYQMPQIIREKIKQDTEKGLLPKKMKPEDLELLIHDLEDEFRVKVSKIQNPDNPLQKQKPSKKQKPRNNRTADGKRKKRAKKAPAAQRFWQRL